MGKGVESQLWIRYLANSLRPCKVDVRFWSTDEILAVTKWPADKWYRSFYLPCVKNEPELACNVCGKLFIYRDAWEFHMDRHEEDM